MGVILMKKAELVFIPSPLMGHIGQAVELAKLMVDRCNQLSITVLVMKLPIDPVGSIYTESLGAAASSSSSSSNPKLERIRFLHLPPLNPTSEWSSKSPGALADLVIESHKAHVRDVVGQLTSQPGSSARLAGFVIDMFCTTMIDVANEFGVPTYVFFTSGAAFLGLMFQFQILHDDHDQDIAQYLKHSLGADQLVSPSFANPVPSSVLPFVLVDKHSWSTRFLRYARRYREAKGIIINTFGELESHALNSFMDGSNYGTTTTPRSIKKAAPLIYPVGPILNRTQQMMAVRSSTSTCDEVLHWLDDQPPSSVVLLCFGTRGSFGRDQVLEIAHGLERSGHRFLWSLRQPPLKARVEFPTEYSNPEEVLPEGFLERTAEIGMGKVIGWVPQMAVLSHPAIGGFVSHCGWNSVLESLWCDVPIATWPIYAEQQLNAYQMVRELGLAVEITLVYSSGNMYHSSSQVMVTAVQIERGIRILMNDDSEVRQKVKEMAQKSRTTVKDGGSSYTCLGSLIEAVMRDL